MLEEFEFFVRLSKNYDFHHVDRVTCEYRFYLDGMNSMINQREKTLDSLQYIYEKHKTSNIQIVKDRAYELETLEIQIRKINLLKEEMNDNPKRKSDLTWQLVKLVLGF